MQETIHRPALAIEGLMKHYRDFVLGPIDFVLEPGTVVGLVGPNGAGKTTTINAIIGLIRHEAGVIKVFGHENNPNNVLWKLDVGYVGDDHTFYEYWSGEKNLRFISQFYPNWSNDRAQELAKRFDLDLKKRADRLSKGNRAKLALISALAHHPRLLLLDEPSSGLDPIVRSEFLDVLWEINETGEVSILYSTHILSDIGRIADELAFLKNGRLVLRDKKEDLVARWGRISFLFSGELGHINSAVDIKREGQTYLVISNDHEVTCEYLRAMNIPNVHSTPMSIDEITIQIMKSNRQVS
jgi:ABC-2 type transport system ATP-binding protein